MKIGNWIAVAVLIVLMSLMFATSVEAQTPEVKDFVAGGLTWNQYATPQINGNFFYMKNVAGGTYSFTMFDVFSKTIKPFTVATSISTGAGQHVKDIGKVEIYALTTVGVVAGGTSVDENGGAVGASWTGGVLGMIHLKKGWCLVPSVRFIKSSFTDFQGAYGLAVGWGQ